MLVIATIQTAIKAVSRSSADKGHKGHSYLAFSELAEDFILQDDRLVVDVLPQHVGLDYGLSHLLVPLRRQVPGGDEDFRPLPDLQGQKRLNGVSIEGQSAGFQ